MKAKLDDSGNPIDAEFDLGFEGDSVHVTVHARGGSAAIGTQTNPGYELLVQLLLERLQSSGSMLEEVRLASRTVAKLSPSERRLQVSGYAMPVCANCHRMLHRSFLEEPMSVEVLREHLQ